jgi:hypothetical protein
MSDCTALTPNTNGSLDECKTRCEETDGCTGLNYDSSGGNVIIKKVKCINLNRIQLKYMKIVDHRQQLNIGENSVVVCTHTDNIFVTGVNDCIDKCGTDWSGFNYISDGGPYRRTPESPPINCSLKKCNTTTDGKMEVRRHSPYSGFDGWFKTTEPNNYIITNT